MAAIDKLIATATAEIGYLEKASNSLLDDKTANAGSNNYTKYARDLDALGIVYNSRKNGYAWCDIFVDWCFIQTFGLETAMKLLCQAYSGLGAGCTSSAKYYKDNGQFHTSNPQPGDQIFFTNDGGKTSNHTGLVVKVDSSRVYTIEGNTSSATGVVANGGSVRNKSYSLHNSKIYGYGRPDWTLVQHTEDSDMIEDVTRLKELWTEMRKEFQDNDASSYSKEARDWAVNNKLIVGNGTTADGEPNYMWGDILTREQFVTVLYRWTQMLGKA